MADPIWLLGPAGDLRPLVCPEKDFDISEVRYGGIFQGLSGATSLNNLGIRQKVTMDFRFLTEEEFAWLRALNRRYLPGPYRLLNPFYRNLLTSGASDCLANTPHLFGTANYQNMTASNGVMTRVRDWPSAAGVYGAMGSKWTNRPGGTHTLRWDDSYKTPVTPGKQYVASVWIKASSSTSGTFIVDWFDAQHVAAGGMTPVTTNLTTSWQRFVVTGVAPAGARLARMAWFLNTSPDISFAAAQLEEGSTPTDWQPGGGAIVVNLDQLTVTTPRFPYRNTTLTLMEA